MFTQADLTYAALFFTSFGFLIGIIVRFWPKAEDMPDLDDMGGAVITHIAPRSRRELTPAFEQKMREANPQFARARDSVLAAESHANEVRNRLTGEGPIPVYPSIDVWARRAV